MNRVIINADDFGIHEEVNAAVIHERHDQLHPHEYDRTGYVL